MQRKVQLKYGIKDRNMKRQIKLTQFSIPSSRVFTKATIKFWDITTRERVLKRVRMFKTSLGITDEG